MYFWAIRPVLSDWVTNSYIKSKQKIRPGVGPLEKSDGSLTAGDQEVAETLNKIFLSQHLPEKMCLVCLFHPLHLRTAYAMLI